MTQQLLSESLNQIIYMADVAGTTVYIEMGTVSQGLEVRVEGFSQTLPRTMGIVLGHLVHRVQGLPAAEFLRAQEILLRKYRNQNLAPTKQVHGETNQPIYLPTYLPTNKEINVNRIQDIVLSASVPRYEMTPYF